MNHPARTRLRQQAVINHLTTNNRPARRHTTLPRPTSPHQTSPTLLHQASNISNNNNNTTPTAQRPPIHHLLANNIKTTRLLRPVNHRQISTVRRHMEHRSIRAVTGSRSTRVRRQEGMVTRSTRRHWDSRRIRSSRRMVDRAEGSRIPDSRIIRCPVRAVEIGVVVFNRLDECRTVSPDCLVCVVWMFPLLRWRTRGRSWFRTNCTCSVS